MEWYQLFSKKNDFTAIIFLNDGTVKKYQFVHNIFKFKTFINSKFNWNYVNIYDRRTKEYLCRMYNN
jgi:hypothetical protein